MRRPRLLHPLTVVIEPLDKGATYYDDDTREQIQILGRSVEVEIPAQVEYRDFVQHGQADATWDRGGYIGEERGYILIRYIDATKRGYTPKVGDKITMIGKGAEVPQPMVTFVHRLKPTMHTRRHGKTGVKLYFADRKPAINA